MIRCAHCGAFNRLGSGGEGRTPICGRCKQALDTSGAPQAVDTATLERAVAGSPIPVLVDFWADWCAPCRAAAPIFEQLGRRWAGKLAVLKLDTEASPQASLQHGVRGIPTFILFSGGREIARQSGMMPPPIPSGWALAPPSRRPPASLAVRCPVRLAARSPAAPLRAGGRRSAGPPDGDGACICVRNGLQSRRPPGGHPRPGTCERLA